MLHPIRPRKDDPLYETKNRDYKAQLASLKNHPENWGFFHLASKTAASEPVKESTGDSAGSGRSNPKRQK